MPHDNFLLPEFQTNADICFHRKAAYVCREPGKYTRAFVEEVVMQNKSDAATQAEREMRVCLSCQRLGRVLRTLTVRVDKSFDCYLQLF